MQQRISDWAKKFNIAVVPNEDRPDHPKGDVVFRLKDLFTTVHGKWDPSGEAGSLTQWARDTYLRPFGAPDYFDDAGGDHHLFARVLDEQGKPLTNSDLVIGWSDGFNLLAQPDFAQHITMHMTPKAKSGWGNQPIFNGYFPERGQRGAWCWCPTGASDVVWGGGMPGGVHVSTFAVWQAEKNGDNDHQSPEQPTPGIDVETLRKAAWQTHGIPYAGVTAFIRYARNHDLGAALTSEMVAGTIRYQGFARGIAYRPEGSGQAIKHVAW